MKDKAKEFLEMVISGILPNGFTIVEDTNEMGTTYVVIPKVESDYSRLIGREGKNARALRTVLKMWCRVNAQSMRSNILIPNPTKIKKEE